MPWSYVIKTGMFFILNKIYNIHKYCKNKLRKVNVNYFPGFQDAFHTLDRLTNHKFDLPVDLAIKHFQNIKDAF